MFRLTDKNILLGTHIRWFLGHGGAVTNSDCEKMSLFIEESVFLRLVMPCLRVGFFFPVVRLVSRLGFFDLRDVDRRLLLRPQPVILVPSF